MLNSIPTGLDALAQNAHAGQWSLDDDIDWDQDIRVPRWLPRRLAVSLVSQFLYGEHATLEVCERLRKTLGGDVSKACLGFQIADERRHAQAYTRYLERLGDVARPDPAMAAAVAAMDEWDGPVEGYLAAYHILLEGEALRSIEGIADVLPCGLFRAIGRRVAVDEARHVAFGRLLLIERLPRLALDERRQIYRWVRHLWRDGAGRTLDEFRVPGVMTRGLRQRWLEEGWQRHRRSLMDVGLLAPEEVAKMEAA